MIPFNKPHLTGKETEYITRAVESGKISGNGEYTRLCHEFFQKGYRFSKCLLTTSCTDALEMAAILMEVSPGDEIIAPSYTFVSTANAFVLRGAKIVFADSLDDHPNIDHTKIEDLISEKTKGIVVVHYGGVACDMDPILEVAKRHSLFIIEDTAQAIDSYYKGRPLGSIGSASCFSFHETKNIISGEGGMLVINDKNLFPRSEIIWEKGTNRTAFFRGEVDKYGWVDIGSSFLPSEVTAAFLYAQLENLEEIQRKRRSIWDTYFAGLGELGNKYEVMLPAIPEYATNNAHLFYLVLPERINREAVIQYLKEKEIWAVFHYLSLHNSKFYKGKHDGRKLPNADRYSRGLLRMPLFFDLQINQVEYIIEETYKAIEQACI